MNDVVTGSVTSSDSGHSTQLDSRSNSSMEVTNSASAGGATYNSGPGGSPPPSQIRRHSALQGILNFSWHESGLGGHMLYFG